MVKTADLGDGDDFTQRQWFDAAWYRRVAIQGKMRPATVVVLEISGQDTTQMGLIEHDHMIQASRRIEPMTRSQYGFCQGDRGPMGTSSMPMPSTRFWKYSP